MMAAPVVHATTWRWWGSIGQGLNGHDERTGWHLVSFMDGIGAVLGAIDDIVRDSPDGPGWSSVFDIDRVADDHVAWLGQMVGVTVPAGITPTAARDRVRRREGWERGTVATIRALIESKLTGNREVYLTERDTSPYHFSVITLDDETPDAAAVVAAIQRGKPAGLQFTHNVVASRPIDSLTGDIDSQSGSIDSLT